MLEAIGESSGSRSSRPATGARTGRACVHPGDPRPRRAFLALPGEPGLDRAPHFPRLPHSLSCGDPPRARADELGVVADTEIEATTARHSPSGAALPRAPRRGAKRSATTSASSVRGLLPRLVRGALPHRLDEGRAAWCSLDERRRRDRRARRRSRGRHPGGHPCEPRPATPERVSKSPRERRAYVEQLRRGPIALQPGKPNEQHYEEPPAFFELVLGPRLKYSSCLWEEGTTTLADAEDAMLALTCERAGLADGMEVLDLGCGWGSLTLYAAERYPGARLTAVSNSRSSASGSRRVRPPTSPSSRPT